MRCMHMLHVHAPRVLGAQDFLQQLAKGAHEAVLASPLPPEAIEPLRAFADYEAFEAMMRPATADDDEVGGLGV